MSESAFDDRGTHRYRLRVYYEDSDAGGIVYHANYLRFAERARTELLRDLGVPHAALVADHGLMFVVRRVKLDYLRPARVDDSLVVLTRPVRVVAASAVLGQVIERQLGEQMGEQLAVAEIGLACVDIGTGRPQRFPARWQSAFARGVRAAAEKE
jgi:acyl-CoA thioester hydrolase